jgi:hypothetical protein
MEQQQRILVAVGEWHGPRFSSWAVFLLAPESRSPARIPGYLNEAAAQAHAERHWPADEHVDLAVLERAARKRGWPGWFDVLKKAKAGKGR